MSTYVGNKTLTQDEAIEREIAQAAWTLAGLTGSRIALAVHVLREMRASGSWDVKTLDRAIEIIERIPDSNRTGE